MVKFLLLIHLTGAAVLAIVLLRALFTVQYVRYAKAIGINTVAQFTSGSLLAVIGQSMGISQVCLNIGVYLAIILLVETILLRHAIRDYRLALTRA